MSQFTINADLCIGYNGEKPLSLDAETIILPSQAGGLTTLNVETSEAEWWTPSDGSRQLSLVARSPSGNTLAVADRRLKATLHVIGAQRRVLQRLVDVCKLQIVDMCYSRDGTRFVVLADAPAHNFSIYNVDPQTERLTVMLNGRDAPPADHQFSFITFNPRSASDLCTSGGGHLTFWKHDADKNSLTPLEGRVTRPNLRITCHEWCIVPGSTVVAGTTSGLLLLFNLTSGVGEVCFDCNTNSNPEIAEKTNELALMNVIQPLAQQQQNEEDTSNPHNNNSNTSNPNSIVAIKVTKHHTIVLTEDGTLRFLACLSSLYPQQQPQQQQQQHGLIPNTSFGASPSQTVSQMAIASGAFGNSLNPGASMNAAGGSNPSFSSTPSGAYHQGAGSNASGAFHFAGTNPHALTLQRVMQVPMIESASCLVANTSTWDTFYVGCKARGTLTAVHIPGYNLPDVDVSTFLTTEMRCRVLVSGIRNPFVGSTFVNDVSYNSASNELVSREGLGKYFATLDSSSILRLFDSTTRREEARIHVGAEPTCIAASSVSPVIIVGTKSGTIRCFQVLSGTGEEHSSSVILRCMLSDCITSQPAGIDHNNVSTASFTAEQQKLPIRMIVPHPTLPVAIAVADESTLVFLPLSDPVRVFGVVHIPSSYEGISSLSWTQEEKDSSTSTTSSPPNFILTLNNSSIILGRYPTDPVMSEDLCYKPEDVIVNSWRTELPMTVAEVALTTDANLLCFGGGVDKETKFFNLDRNASADRKDRESKALKMPLAFRDHEKQLVSIKIINSKYLLTAGSDGRIVVRDVACLLSTAPNLREIRKDALAVAPRHVSLLGGVKSISVSRTNRRLLTSGFDGSTLLWSLGSLNDVQEQNHRSARTLVVSPDTNFWQPGDAQNYPTLPAVLAPEEEMMDFRDKRKKLALDFDRSHAKNEHERIRKQVASLQDKLRQVYLENEQAADDEKADLLDFVVKHERQEFDSVCGEKVREMKHKVKMEDLRCDYTAEFIKKTRWDSMKTQLNILQGLTYQAEEPVSVHNFAVPHEDKAENDTLRKVKFLRRMQERNKFVSAKKAVARFAALSGEIDPYAYGNNNNNNNNRQLLNNNNNSNGYHGEQHENNNGDQNQQQEQDDNDAEQQSKVPSILNSDSWAAISNHLSSVDAFLFEPRETFAKVRAVMQSKLLRARVHAMRVAFNEKFAALVTEKKAIIHQASERTNKCKIIQLQLGGDSTSSLVQLNISDKEDPSVVLNVDDEDVKEDRSNDPTFKKKKAQEEAEQDRWRRVHGSDDGPERALKAWMDGRLDKEIKPIVAKLDPPDFADETSNKYVPQDDWTDEQQKIYREYEKKLEKLVETVNDQRRKLEQDFHSMQKATRDAIAKFDAKVKTLFNERVRIAQHCSEAELARVKLSLNFMDFIQVISELAAKEHHHVELQNKLIAAAETTRRYRAKLDTKRQQMAQLKADEAAKEKTLKMNPPFSTSEELSRWWFAQQQKRKRGGGGARVGGLNLKERQKQAKAAAAAKKQQDAAMGQHQYISPDPWEFLEREKIEAEEARRQEDQVIQANGAAVQYPDRPEMINEHVWQDFLDYIDERASKERLVKKMQEEVAEMTQEDGRLCAVEDELRAMAEDAQHQRDLKQRRMIEALFDVDQLFVFRQGNVEYEQDPFITEYGDAVLIETRRVNALNSDIRTRGSAKIELMREEAARARELRQIDWETRHAEYQTRILELECKQLQTLRVTKQMQEFISGGGEDHNERQRAKLREKIDHVRKTMTQRIEDKKTQMAKVKRQTREREIENNMLIEQVNHADALLGTRRHVHDLHATDTDAELPQRLMRDMRITRRLEDVAKAQIEEMEALKKEVDRLRGRTFPSFAVVSKRVIGSSGAPDARQQQQFANTSRV